MYRGGTITRKLLEARRARQAFLLPSTTPIVPGYRLQLGARAGWRRAGWVLLLGALPVTAGLVAIVLHRLDPANWEWHRPLDLYVDCGVLALPPRGRGRKRRGRRRRVGGVTDKGA